MSSQDQAADGAEVAIQSGRDTILNRGLSIDDMRQIIEALGQQIPHYTAIAREVVDARLVDFEKSMLEKFTQPNAARPEAFKDPDFQYLFGKAQDSYARCGDETVRDTLVDLIARRSREEQRSRLSLTLNDSIEIAAVLTKSEFAELAVAYHLKMVQFNGVGNLQGFAEALQLVVPMLRDVSRHDSSYQYLEARSCATIGVLSVDLHAALVQKYGGIFCKGFERAAIDTTLPAEKTALLDSVVIPCLNDPAKVQFSALNKEVFKDIAKMSGLTDQELDQAYALQENNVWSEQELISAVRPLVPEIELLFDLWKNTPLHRLVLTTVGIAIGHAKLVGTGKFDAELAIWIK
jgi:hypothetical protein